MRKISIKEAEEGMVLAEAILDSRKREVYREGITLTDASISRIFELGIRELSIVAEEPEQVKPNRKLYDKYKVNTPEALRTQIEARFKRLFSLHPKSDSIAHELKRLGERLELTRARLTPDTKSKREAPSE